MNVTEKLARFIVDTSYNDIPQKTIDYAKDLALSTIGSMVWGSTLPAGKIVIKLVKEMGGVPESGVMGGGFKTSAPNAALANGNFAHAAEWEGDSRPEMVSGMSLFPVVFPVGEKLGLSGQDVLEATVIGHEVQSRIGLACLPATRRGFFAVPVFGNFGAAVATAKMLKLDVNQITVALSITASQAAGTLRQHSTMTHFVETGFACRNGVMAAMLAKEGFTADTNILEDSIHGVGFGTAVAGKEGYQMDKLTEGLGKQFRVDLIDTKNFPCHSLLQRTLEATLHLVIEHNISYDEVESVEIEMKPGVANELDLPDPPDGEHTRVSMQHGVAGALLEGKVGRETFTDEKRVDPLFKEARKKVRLIAHLEWESEQKKDSEIVTIKLKDGRKHRIKWETWKGHHTSPLTKDELIAKYKDATGETLSPNQINRSVKMVLDLENLKDVSRLMEIITFPDQ